MIYNFDNKKVLLFPAGMAYLGEALRVDRDPKTKPDVIADMYHSPFKPGSFDVLVCDPPYKAFVTGDNRFRWFFELMLVARERVLLSSNIHIEAPGWTLQGIFASVTHQMYIRLWLDFSR